jgi:predicted amidohydrolase
MKRSTISRRNFLQKATVTAGAACVGSIEKGTLSMGKESDGQKLPREVWIAGISQEKLNEDTAELMIKRILDRLKGSAAFRPDFVCLPEVFPFANVEKKYTLPEKLELSDFALKQFSEFSRSGKCYTICPVFTKKNGKVYNSAVVFDRSGNKIGQYDKIHLTEGEIEGGCTCGAFNQPVIKTEFGNIGVQICFDIEWDDGWSMLRKQGADLVFWVSAFGGGKAVNTKAWKHKYVVASSTNKSTSKLCDIDGEVIASTGIWNPNLYCGGVNLEKVFLHIWPYVYKFKDIHNKYGRNVGITIYHEEEWESLKVSQPISR